MKRISTFDKHQTVTTTIKSLMDTTLGLRPCALISEFSKPAQLWRERPTPSAEAILMSRWWDDYSYDYISGHACTWADWCTYVMILGPPRPRSEHELAELDEDYLTQEDDALHFYPWRATWPHPSDKRWCTPKNGVPEWAQQEFNA